ncbi:efflux RND transporter periplasmic adaptor subunit [Coraliomargarita algicola]|uniref:Efflux RND transporter periplasmic adaptor subunit n=1 Tax=Coraliomargarita algicola TaxID=3092156 RepID=A0ABZ0RJQ2_9BACT|nr:efflux RND transporter periplasmic adaptor subunit [Coraliomargarita sp. J2-16]WPJ95152.1 efflux RND transporter periplasmic adaptor subunit [Coraliomargarita sp. J2-16]
MGKKIIFIIAIIVGVGAILAGLVITKLGQFSAMAEAGKNGGPPPSTVSVTTPRTDTWETRYKSVGSIEPVRGILIETESAGVVDSINFENGQEVKAGDLLVQLDIDVEKAQLRAAEATVQLTQTEFERATRLRQSGNVPQSDLDRAAADMERAQAEIQNLKALIDRKTIVAPFDGRVGIRQINLGQYVPTGSPIVSLEADEQVYVNFSLPQKTLSKINTGMKLDVTSDAYPEQTFVGQLTAISPVIDPSTRSVALQGTIDNPESLLRSGLFVNIELVSEQTEEVLLIPSTAILYAPYGNSVYVVESQQNEDGSGERLIVKQKFIRIGRSRGDFVSVLDGVTADERIVSSGAFKLRNGAAITINNDLEPQAQLAPAVDNS